jgi:hypothetical protein
MTYAYVLLSDQEARFYLDSTGDLKSGREALSQTVPRLLAGTEPTPFGAG